jgi:hypothetical protein
MKAIKEKMKMVGWAILLAGVLAGGAYAQEPSDGLVPTVRVMVPNLGNQSAKIMPPSFSVGVLGHDADSATLLPVKYRYLLMTAQYDTTAGGDPSYIRTAFEYNLHGGDLLFWDDPGWSSWLDYPQEGDPPTVEFPSLEDEVYYLMALQVMDADGAVSTALDYQKEVFNFQVREGYYRPEVTLCETFLGCTSVSVSHNEIAAGQPLNFSWIGDAAHYGGTIVSYRHGWDLVDPEDPNDPGWVVPAGLEPENFYDPERSFNDGLHTFTLVVTDDSSEVTQLVWTLSVVPYVSPDNQRPLLVIDQVYDPDGLNQNWPDQNGIPRNQESYRNAYWQFLEGGSGGVAHFDWDRDRMDHRETPSYADLVMYRAVLCYAQFNDQNQTMFRQFRPVNGEDQYVWLAPYQFRGGNYFQVGGRSMESYLEGLPNYMVPIIFDTDETVYVAGGDTYVVGFGQMEMPDGSVVPRGPAMYPYATAGIAALDWTSPNTKYIYGRTTAARNDRNVDCVGLKGMTVDPDFRANHNVSHATLADTFFTDQVIDWHDGVDADADTLALFSDNFVFREDEFVDGNISPRTTPLVPQECVDGPDGMCVEPMFRGISRMDWMREYYWAQGEADWPHSEYSAYELEQGCGPLGMTSYGGIPLSGARTNGQTFGYFSYKMVEEKPIHKADVYWGFDPYRFDHTETQKAIRWVLDYFGLQINP